MRYQSHPQGTELKEATRRIPPIFQAIFEDKKTKKSGIELWNQTSQTFSSTHGGPSKRMSDSRLELQIHPSPTLGSYLNFMPE